MMKESPLDLRKDIKILEEAIEDCGSPLSESGKIKLAILQDRLRQMKQGTGFTRGFAHVHKCEIDYYKSNV
jgi:hypothetical protein